MLPCRNCYSAAMKESEYLLGRVGLLPAHPISLLFPLATLAFWLLCLPIAYLRRVSIFYNASLRAAFVEEVVFRGLAYGLADVVTGSRIWALVVSSLLFGIFHMRNLWWAGWRRSWKMTKYAGFTGGPVLGLIRIFWGDIYLGIFLHFVHNFFVTLPLPGMGRYVAETPKDAEMREIQERRSGRIRS
jgi:membrane protease YdiL (CAAX protease family)